MYGSAVYPAPTFPLLFRPRKERVDCSLLHDELRLRPLTHAWIWPRPMLMKFWVTSNRKNCWRQRLWTSLEPKANDCSWHVPSTREAGHSRILVSCSRLPAAEEARDIYASAGDQVSVGA